MAPIACITHNEELLSLEIASQHFLHERTKTSNRLRRDGEMTIAILRMPISIKLTFGQQGCSGLFCNHNRHCRLFIVPVRPVRPPGHGPLKDPGKQPSRTLALRASSVGSSTPSAINLAWNGDETPDHSASRPGRDFGGTEGGAGRSQISVSPLVSKLSQTGKAIAAGVLDAICLIYSAIPQGR